MSRASARTRTRRECIDDHVRSLGDRRNARGIGRIAFHDDQPLVVGSYGRCVARHTDYLVAAIQGLARDALRDLTARSEEYELHGAGELRREISASIE